MAYRVPRRFILPPDDPPPYGFVALSLVGHGIFLLAAMIFSVYVSAQIDRSNVYIVNLVPSPPSLGTATPQAAPRPSVERPVKPPEPAPKPQKAEEREPPKPQKAEAPSRETPPPRPERAPERVPEPPPAARPSRAPEVARAVPPRPDELALPRRAEKEAPVLETSAARERLREPTPLAPRPPTAVAAPPTPPPPARPVEPPPPRVAPPPTPAAPPLAAVASRPVEPVPLGRPDAGTAATGSISLDVSDFPFTYYLRQIQAKISERWSRPRVAAGGGERVVVVIFEIGRDGQIKEPKVERESGNLLYDQSALRAVVDASPFPPLPSEFKAPFLRVHFGFEFRPDQG